MRTKERFSVFSFQFLVRLAARRLLLTAYCLLLTALSFSTAKAQDELPPPPPLMPSPVAQPTPETIETIRVDTDLVDLNVSVFGRDRERPIGELRQQDFQVLENGVPQEVSFFASAATPFDLVLLLDLSGSTVDKLDLVRKSARRFVEAARPTDRVAVVTFTDTARVVSPLTFDRQDLIAQIKKIKRPQGGTKFWDALHFVIESVLERSTDNQRRSAVVVMTDGVDNALPDVPGDGSVTGFDRLLELVRAADAVVLPIYLDTETEMLKQHRWYDIESTFALARQHLAQLAAESGSLLYSARKVEDLKGVYQQVIRDLGMIYSIGYSPTNKERDGTYRAITVQLVNRADLAARTRRGYIAK